MIIVDISAAFPSSPPTGALYKADAGNIWAVREATAYNIKYVNPGASTVLPIDALLPKTHPNNTQMHVKIDGIEYEDNFYFHRKSKTWKCGTPP